MTFNHTRNCAWPWTVMPCTLLQGMVHSGYEMCAWDIRYCPLLVYLASSTCRSLPCTARVMAPGPWM